MPRRREVPKRPVLPDPLYQSVLLTQLINAVMNDGKKNLSERIVYGAMDIVKGQVEDEPLKVFKRAMDNIKPRLEVKSRRVGGSTYQIPVEVGFRRQTSLALRWLIKFASARGEHTMSERLAHEVMDASNNRGSAVKKREDTHKMAEANRAFAHYRW
jgi:small subunit ribosomal protein S7